MPGRDDLVEHHQRFAIAVVDPVGQHEERLVGGSGKHPQDGLAAGRIAGMHQRRDQLVKLRPRPIPQFELIDTAEPPQPEKAARRPVVPDDLAASVDQDRGRPGAMRALRLFRRGGMSPKLFQQAEPHVEMTGQRRHGQLFFGRHLAFQRGQVLHRLVHVVGPFVHEIVVGVRADCQFVDALDQFRLEPGVILLWHWGGVGHRRSRVGCRNLPLMRYTIWCIQARDRNFFPAVAIPGPGRAARARQRRISKENCRKFRQLHEPLGDPADHESQSSPQAALEQSTLCIRLIGGFSPPSLGHGIDAPENPCRHRICFERPFSALPPRASHFNAFTVFGGGCDAHLIVREDPAMANDQSTYDDIMNAFGYTDLLGYVGNAINAVAGQHI